MEVDKKMNVLVIGPSGAGKTTLIKAISGRAIETGIGESQTKKICEYDSDIWPLRLIDTKGFEYSYIEKIKTINQIKKYTKKHVKADKEDTIDAVWYCIDGMTGRVFFENIKSLSKSIKDWKNIPIFVVITKSLVKERLEETKKVIKDTFNKAKNMNLKDIIPIVAESYKINDETSIEPFGIEELCEKTLACYDEAKDISIENVNQMILSQKRFTSQSIIAGSSAAGLTIGLLPIPSSPALVPLEITMMQSILKVYGVKLEKSILLTSVSSGVVSSIGKGLAELGIKLIPGATIVYGVVASVIITALGESTILVAENIYNGKISSNDIEAINETISDGFKNNPLINSFKTYLINNKDFIKGKSANEVFSSIVKSTKKQKK